MVELRKRVGVATLDAFMTRLYCRKPPAAPPGLASGRSLRPILVLKHSGPKSLTMPDVDSAGQAQSTSKEEAGERTFEAAGGSQWF